MQPAFVLTADDIQRFWSFVQRTTTCWLWTGTQNKDGYGRFYAPSLKQQVLVHRLAYELRTRKPVPDGMMILHTCTPLHCVRDTHLFQGKSPRPRQSNLPPEDVDEIRFRFQWELQAKTTRTQACRKLAEAYGLTDKRVWGLTREITAETPLKPLVVQPNLRLIK